MTDPQKLEKPLGALKAKIEARKKYYGGQLLGGHMNMEDEEIAEKVITELDVVLSEIRKVKLHE